MILAGNEIYYTTALIIVFVYVVYSVIYDSG